MTAKVNQKTETSKFSVEKGKLCCNGKSYNECNFDEKQSFNDFLKDEDDEKFLEMLRMATMPLINRFVTPITSTGLYKSVPHFV